MMPVRREICRWMHRIGARKVLDICCGTGHQDRLLAEAGIRVVGIDRSPSMLRIAGAKSGRRIPFLLSDARQLPFKDGSFDGALISFALHENEPDLWHPMIREAIRVLRPEGRLLIVDYFTQPPAETRAASIVIDAIEWMAGERHYRNYKRYMDCGGLNHVLRQHPLRTMEIKCCFMGSVGFVLSAPEHNKSTPDA